MIHSVSANQESFHRVEFTQGLNIILAERSETSTQKDTRNGLGKTTLINIIDFCLGSSITRGKGLLIDPLAEWVFTLEITLRGNRVKVTRSVREHKRVVIEGKTDGWVEQPDKDKRSGNHVFKIDQWRTLLGWVFFDLLHLEDQPKYKPSCRSLLSYFIRRGADAYLAPFQHFKQQKTWDVQLHVSYLLGMNWEYAARWQDLKDKEEGIRAFDRAIRFGVVEGVVGTVGELETQRIQLEQQTDVARRALDTFKVHPQYEAIQQAADRLTREIHDLSNLNVTDRRLLSLYQESIKEERPPSAMLLENLYEESGFVFSDEGRRLLDEARTFHSQIISNRREFLETEINRLQQVISDREKNLRQLTDERAEVLQVLETHGALQEMTALREMFTKLRESLNRIDTRLKEMKDLQATKRSIRAGKAELVQIAQQDHEQRRDIWSTAVRLFNEHSQTLYESPGKLVIDVGDTGYKYKVEINRSGSEGIDKMKILCFDLAILQLQIQANRGANFLIHDTLMYDSVDTRQRALAFELANKVTSALGGQYICTMNSDMIPKEYFSEGFDFEEHVRIRLSDADPSGSLLGISFEVPENDPPGKSS